MRQLAPISPAIHLGADRILVIGAGRGTIEQRVRTEAYPSPTDVRQAVDPAWVYVLVSLRHGEPALRAYSAST
jgi:hypothetical protein